jgi:hypothetical protein
LLGKDPEIISNLDYGPIRNAYLPESHET